MRQRHPLHVNEMKMKPLALIIPSQRKTVFTLALLLCLWWIAASGWSNFAHNGFSDLDQQGQAYLDDTLLKASSAFLLARALNAAISVLQSFTVTPFIGALTLGEVLDPANDLIESFSWMMLAVMVAIGVQKLLLDIGVNLDLSVLLLLALSLLLLALWLREDYGYRLGLLAYRLLFLCLLIRFAIPLACALEASVVRHFLADKQNAAMNSLQACKLPSNK